MKKHVSIILLFLLLGALILPMQAKADVIYEPFDSFYEKHRDECEYVCRTYTASGPNGDVSVYESPESARVEAVLGNGEEIYISYTYEDAAGILWGCCESWSSDLTGWVPMDYLTVVYDGISFEEEYGDQFVSVQIVMEATGETVYFWEYPGSRNYIDVKVTEDYCPEFRTSYTDPDGNQWARCSYYMGIRGYWVNLSNATADYETLFPNHEEETVPQTEVPEIQSVQAKEIVPKEPASVRLMKIICTIAVAAVVIVTGLMLYRLKKKK